MRKFKAIALGVAAVFAIAAIPTAFVAADEPNPQTKATTPQALVLNPQNGPACSRQSAGNASGLDIFLSTGNNKTYTGTAWQPVDCTSTTFRLSNNQRALVVADVSAETDCVGSAPDNGQWCEARALLNNIEGKPVASEPDSFAFDNVSGDEFNWQAHSFQRAWEVRCANTAGCQYRFVVQTKNHDSTATSLWLDEVAVHLRATIGNAVAL